MQIFVHSSRASVLFFCYIQIPDLVGSANIMLLPEECSICIAVGKIAQIRKNFWLSVVNLTCLLCKSVLRILSGLIGFSAAGFK